MQMKWLSSLVILPGQQAKPMQTIEQAFIPRQSKSRRSKQSSLIYEPSVSKHDDVLIPKNRNSIFGSLLGQAHFQRLKVLACQFNVNQRGGWF